MRRYSTYKDTGIDWIGEIPKTWEIMPMKRFTQVKRGASPRPIDDPKYFDENGEFGWVRIADVTASERYLERTTQKLSELGASLSVKRYPGDLFLSIAGTVGKPIISKIKCCIHDGFVWFPDLKIDPEFLYYIFSAGLAYRGLGKMGTQLNLNTDTVGYISLPLPSKEEICQIVKYLNGATEEIDNLISKKERMIDLLQEERSVVINQAVTKGIVPNVEMKDSGTEWLGNIPNHWQVLKLKWVSQLKYGSSLSDNKRLTGDVPVYGSNGIVGYHNEALTHKPTIIIGRKGSFGKLNFSEEACFPIDTTYYIDDTSTRNNLKWLYYALCILKLDSLSKDSAVPGLNREDAYKKFVAVPPLEEQNEIVKYLEQENDRVDSCVGKVLKEIELLKEYRTALISEVVTGKIDVRDEVVSWT